MSKSSRNQSNSGNLLEPLLVSSLRCHLVGATLSLILLLAIGWIWTNADVFAKDKRYSPKQIEQAMELVADADHLRSEYADSLLISNQNERRLAAIQSWLPRSIEWDDTNERISDIAKSIPIELMSVDRGEQQTGQRVGVWRVTCEVRGSYFDLCRFLDRLSNDSNPIWCDSIRIQRFPPDADEAPECGAFISLRVPFAANGSVAAKLIQSEVADAI